jgi:hypothetical protein
MRPLLLALLAAVILSAPVPAAAVQETAAELRATGLVGERYDGYLGMVAEAPPQLRARVEAVNIRRRSHYTGLATRRGARVEEVAVAAACEIFAARVQPGQHYMLHDNVWRRRGAGPIARPDYCE